MFQKLASHNDDIKRLVEKGYSISFDRGYLIVRDIPYLDESGSLKWGAFVSKITLIDGEKAIQEDHQVFFAGGVPHNLDGKPIPNLGGGPTSLQLSPLSEDVIVQRSFSNKPRLTGVFVDFYEKIESYTGIISGPAMHKYGVDPYKYRTVMDDDQETVFNYYDTLTSRAEIGEFSSRLKEDIVAVIGLGGTGAYILDFISRTPVKEIRAFDKDSYFVHNAFRSPGRLEKSELGLEKADVYRSRYEGFRKNMHFICKKIDRASGDDLANISFAFVCVDKGESRAGIMELLSERHIPYIDVGMGFRKRRNGISGMIRTTYFPTEKASTIREKNLVPLVASRSLFQSSPAFLSSDL